MNRYELMIRRSRDSGPAGTSYTYASEGASGAYDNGVYVYDASSNTAVCESAAAGDRRRIAHTSGYWQIEKWMGDDDGWLCPDDAGAVYIYSSDEDIDAVILGAKTWTNDFSGDNETVTITKG